MSRFLTPFKFPLAGGYNVVYGGNETGKTALARVLAATFDANYAAAVADRLRPVVPQEGVARYGALFEHNGARYRLLRDLQGGVNLARLDPATQKFALVAKDEQGVQNFLQDELDFPMDGRHVMLGLVDRHLAPAGGFAPAAAAAPSFGGGYDYGDDGPADDQPADVEATLKILRHELQVLGSVGELEFRVDGLVKKKFETEANLAKWKDVEAKLEKYAKRTEEIGEIQKLTPELESRIKNLDETEKYQRNKLSAIDAEIATLEKQLDVLEPKAAKRFQKDPFFIAGAVVALLGFVLPFFTIEYLVILGFAGAGFLAYLFFMVYPKVQEQLDEVNKKYKTKTNEEERVKKEFQSATAVINELVGKLKVLDAKDLLAVAAEWHAMSDEQAAIATLREELTKTVGDPAKLRADHARQEAEIALFEEELRNAGAITRDANQIQAEIKRLEGLRDGGGRAASGPVAAGAPGPAAPGAGESIGALLQTAAEVGRMDYDRFLAAAREKINTYLRALSGGKLGPAEIGDDGSFSLARAEFGNARFGLGQLSDGARDTALVAVRLGVLETILPSRSFPVILDDPFALLDEQRQAVAAKALRRIAALAQVVHFAPQKSFLAAADGKVELK